MCRDLRGMIAICHGDGWLASLLMLHVGVMCKLARANVIDCCGGTRQRCVAAL